MLTYRPSTRTCSTRETGQPSSQCKGHDAGAITQPMKEAYGAQLRRSTSPTALNSYDRRGIRRSTQPIHERYDVPRPDADGWCGTKLTSTERYHLQLSRRCHLQISRLQRGRNPLQGATAMDDYISPSDESGLADRASSQASKWASRCSRWAPQQQQKKEERRWEVGEWRENEVQARSTLTSTAPKASSHNIEERIMVKKAVKRYCSNNLKNDYESEEINSQDSEHEDKKSDNQYSECDDKEETYAYYNETL